MGRKGSRLLDLGSTVARTAPPITEYALNGMPAVSTGGGK
jgi:hypothetical protein